VCQPAGDDVLLVVLEDRSVRRLLAIQGDVEDGVKAGRPGQRTSQLALGHAERMRILATSVEHTRDQALTAQTPRRGGAALLALLHIELDSFACHGAAV
jgi:hypothetical protein